MFLHLNRIDHSLSVWSKAAMISRMKLKNVENDIQSNFEKFSLTLFYENLNNLYCIKINKQDLSEHL